MDVLLTHLHMDHIIGLGFFGPLFNPSMEVGVSGVTSQQDAQIAQAGIDAMKQVLWRRAGCHDRPAVAHPDRKTRRATPRSRPGTHTLTTTKRAGACGQPSGRPRA